MFISEQMKQAIIDAVMPKLADAVLGMVPPETLQRVVALAQSLPEDYQLLRGQVARIEQHQETIIRLLETLMGDKANAQSLDDAREQSRISA